MADQECHQQQHQPHYPVQTGDEVAEVETKDRGFDFSRKKEEEIKKTECNQEEAIVADFEKIEVSEPDEQKVVECKEKDKKHGSSLLEKLNRSGSSSSSSSDEEEGLEGSEKKKKKKGLKEKIKEKIAGEEEVKIEKYNDHDNAIPIEKCEEAAAEVQPTEEKGFLEKVKEKLPGQTKKTEEEPLPTAVVECLETEPKEKKGLLEKIKEKIPGYHSKTEDKENEKEKECETH